MSIGGKLLRSSVVRTSQIFLQVAVALVMTPIIVHSLGDRMYGFWVLIGTFLGYYGLLDLGLSSAVARFLSRAVGQDNREEANKVVNTALVIFSLVGAAVLALSGLAVILCGRFIHNPGEVALFRKLILLLGVSVAVGFPMRVFGGVLDSHLRHDLTAYPSVIRLIAANICIFFLLRHGYGIYALAVVSFFGGMMEYLMLYVLARRVMPELKVRPAFYAREMVRRLFEYSGKTFVAQLADILRFKVDSVVIAAFLDVSLITHYSVGARLIDYFSQMMVSAVGMLAPVFSQYEGRGDFEAIRKSFLKATRISVIISVFIGTSILFYGKPFIQRWMGAGYEDSYKVAAILAGAYIFAMMQVPSLNLLYGISKHHFVAVLNMGEGIFNLAATLLLVRYYGIYGVAMGTAVSMVVCKVIFQPLIVCRCINLRLADYLRTVAACIVKCLIPLGIYYYIAWASLRPDYGNIASMAAMQTLCFAIIGYWFFLDGEERFFIRNLGRNRSLQEE